MCKVFGPYGGKFLGEEDRRELMEHGFFLQELTGNEHPHRLLRQTVHGDFFSAGKPHVLVHENRIIATMSGDEGLYCSKTIASLREAINIVRDHRGMLREFDHVR